MTARFTHNVWQKICTAELKRCASLPPHQRKSAWRQSRRYLLQVIKKCRGTGSDRPTRIIIADLDGVGIDISGFDLSFSYIIRCNFSNASLRNAHLTQSIIRDCDFKNSDVSGAHLSRSTFGSTVKNLVTIKYDDYTRFDIRTGDLPPIELKFIKDRINADTRRYQGNEKRSPLATFWLNTTNHGRRLSPIFLSVLIIYICGIVVHFSNISYGKDYTQFWSILWKSLILSSDAIIGTDPSTEMTNDLWRSFFNLQSGLSLMLMALLIAALTHKTTSPANDA